MLKVRPERFEIISFSAGKNNYYPSHLPREDWMEDHYIKFTEMDIPMGHSRYGGPVIDLPREFEHPKGMRFVAQLRLSDFAPFDPTGLLPKNGQLYFFMEPFDDRGQVIYIDVDNSDLVRKIYEHEDNFFLGALVTDIRDETEAFDQRFRDLDEMEIEECDECFEEDFRDCDCEKDMEFTSNGKIWDDFAGSETSKMFGIFTHCQWAQEDIEALTLSEKFVLLQVGENGFNDTGVVSVVIPKNDLKAHNFKNCEFHWAQT